MRQLVVLIVLILCLSSLAFSQQGGRVFGFFVPGQVRAVGVGSTGGDSKAFMGFGGGGMYLGSKGFGGGADVGIVGPMKHFDDRDNFARQSVGLFTLNGVKVFKLGTDRVEPLVTSGYGRTFMRQSGANWWEVGGGVNLWFSKRLGAAVEFRDYIRRNDRADWWQFVGVRLGLTLRD